MNRKRNSASNRNATIHICGFTLVEMIATLALAALLMVGILHITLQLNRSGDYVGDDTQNDSRHITIFSVIKDDIRHATHWRLDEKTVQLAGPIGTNNQAEHNRTPAIVWYEVVQHDNLPYLLLVRRESTVNNARRIERTLLLGHSISHIMITPSFASETQRNIYSALLPSHENHALEQELIGQEWTTIPSRVTIQLVESDTIITESAKLMHREVIR